LADVLVKQEFTEVHQDMPVIIDGYAGRYLEQDPEGFAAHARR
jgi:hypothetical protein